MPARRHRARPRRTGHLLMSPDRWQGQAPPYGAGASVDGTVGAAGARPRAEDGGHGIVRSERDTAPTTAEPVAPHTRPGSNATDLITTRRARAVTPLILTRASLATSVARSNELPRD